MFGCNHFSETEMLLYIEGSASQNLKTDIETHLMECTECLSEALELSKIQSRMNRTQIGFESLPHFISLKLKNHRLFVEQVIGFQSFEPEFQAVRSGNQGLGFEISELSVRVILMPTESGDVNLEIETKQAMDYALRARNEPVESGRLEAGKNLIENLRPETYTLFLNKYFFSIKLEGS